MIAGYFNPLDIGAAALILLFMFFGGRRGLIRSLFGLTSFFVSILLANLLYPSIGRILRETGGLYERLRDALSGAQWLPDAAGYTSRSSQNLFISGLNLPDFMKFSLMENNNAEAYGILEATGLSDYIGGFLANVVINVLSMLIAFVVVYFGMKLLGKLLDAIARLPVLSFINRLGGLAIGFLQGVLVIWLVFAGFTLFLSRPYFAEFMELLGRSNMAAVLYDNNFILHMVMRLAP